MVIKGFIAIHRALLSTIEIVSLKSNSILRCRPILLDIKSDVLYFEDTTPLELWYDFNRSNRLRFLAEFDSRRLAGLTLVGPCNIISFLNARWKADLLREKTQVPMIGSTRFTTCPWVCEEINDYKNLNTLILALEDV